MCGNFLYSQVLDPSFTELPNSSVEIVTFTDTYVYIGGSFTTIGSMPVSRVARYFRSTGQFDATWRPQVDGTVSTIAVSNQAVFVGGTFMSVEGISRVHVAKLSLGTGALDTNWNPGAGTYTNAITLQVSIPSKMEVVDNYLYIGGNFQTVGSLSRPNLAKVSTLGTGDVDKLWNPAPNQQVMSFVIKDNYMYVGGDFTSIGGVNRTGLAKISLDGNGSADATWDAHCSGNVWDMELDNSTLYVSGQYGSIGNQTILSLARLDINTTVVDTTWLPSPSRFFVGGLAVSNSHVYVTCNGNIGGANKYPVAKIKKNGAAVTETNWGFIAPDPFLLFAAFTYDNVNDRLFIGGMFRNSANNLYVLNEKTAPVNPELQLDAGTIGITDGNSVSLWNDSKGNDDNASQSIVANQPTYRHLSPFTIGGKPCVQFGAGKGMSVPANAILSGGNEKTIFAVFRTGKEVVSKQVIIELGGASGGFNMYIQGFQLYAGAWGQNGGWHINRQVLSDRVYLAQFVYEGNKVRLSLTQLNGTTNKISNSVSFAQPLLNGTNANGIGCVSDQTRFHNGYSYDVFNFSFLGDIAETIVLNTSQLSQRDSIYNSLITKYGFAQTTQPLPKESDFDVEDNNTTSLSEFNIIAYPNPSHEQITISGVGNIHSISMYSTDGIMIMEKILKNNHIEYTFSTEGLSSGIYRLLINTDTGIQSTMVNIIK